MISMAAAVTGGVVMKDRRLQSVGSRRFRTYWTPYPSPSHFTQRLVKPNKEKGFHKKTYFIVAPSPSGSPSPSLIPDGLIKAPATESSRSWSTSSQWLSTHTKTTGQIDVAVLWFQPCAYVGFNELSLYALRSVASSISKFSRGIVRSSNWPAPLQYPHA